jgi:hypothetical protein
MNHPEKLQGKFELRVEESFIYHFKTAKIFDSGVFCHRFWNIPIFLAKIP